MLKNAYLPAKIGADTAENEQNFAEILTNFFDVTRPRRSAGHQPRLSWSGSRFSSIHMASGRLVPDTIRPSHTGRTCADTFSHAHIAISLGLRCSSHQTKTRCMRCRQYSCKNLRKTRPPTQCGSRQRRLRVWILKQPRFCVASGWRL